MRSGVVWTKKFKDHWFRDTFEKKKIFKSGFATAVQNSQVFYSSSEQILII